MGDAKALIQHFHKVCCELRAMVGDNFSRNAMKTEDLSIVYVSNAFYINIQGYREDMHLLTIMINIDDYSIILANLR